LSYVWTTYCFLRFSIYLLFICSFLSSLFILFVLHAVLLSMLFPLRFRLESA
jgi:hypothetical protein